MARAGWRARWSAAGLLAVAACGPDAEPQWSFAVLRPVEGGTYPDAEVWLVDDAGRERGVPGLDEPLARTEWIGWMPDGVELVLRRANVLWRWDGERFADAPFVNPQFDVGRVWDGHVFEDGSAAVVIHVSGSAVPGLYGWDEWNLALAGPDGSAEILAQTNGLDVSMGAGPTVVWTATRFVADPDMDLEEQPDPHRSRWVFHRGARNELEGPADARPVVSPTGEQIAWLGPAAVAVTDLEGHELDRIEAPADVIAWSPDARRIAGSNDAGGWRYTFDSGALEPLDVAGSKMLAWSPSGDVLAVETGCEAATERRIRVIDDGGERWSSPCGSHHFADWSPDGARIATRAARVSSSTAGPSQIHTIGGEPAREIAGGFLAFRPQ